MARLPVPGSDNGAWGTLLNDFLSVAHTADGFLKPIAKGTLDNAIQASLAKADTALQAADVVQQFSQSITLLDPAVSTVPAWRAPYACRIIRIIAIRVGGSGATVNARKNGGSAHLVADLSLATTGSWLDGGTVQHTDYALGDSLEIMITGVAGSPEQVAVQIDFQIL